MDKKFKQILFSLADSQISEEELHWLECQIQSDPASLEYYVEFVIISECLRNYCEIHHKSPQAALDYASELETFANYEKAAAPLHLKKTHPPLPQSPIPKSDSKGFRRSAIISIAASAAAILFLVLFARFAPPRSEMQVATLQDSLNARWAGPSLHNGARLVTGSELLLLREGLVKLVFDNGTAVVLEAPAEFQLLSGDQIKLNHGRIYAIVPPQAYGFQVMTPNAAIIDLGTEFGVHADINGDTSLHVIKGSTRLIAGTGVGKKNSTEVVKGIAKKVSRNSAKISTISLEERHFARAFDSVNNVIWRQQPSLDLADIVRAGNGTGTGSSAVRLDPIKGFTSDWNLEISAAKGYLRIQDSPFIDGIFIPNGRTPQIVSSRGDIFEECPETNGLYYIDLFANPTPNIIRTKSGKHTIYFNGQEYSDQGKSCIVMHGNHGITFDLDALRRHYGRRINRFVSRIGITDFGEGPCNADFYVLLDGRPFYSLRRYEQKGVLNDVSVAVEDTHRFLTLVTTAGPAPGNADGDVSDSAFLAAWSIFTEPVLLLE